MTHDYPITYLNDHLAGLVARLETLGYPALAHEGETRIWLLSN
jgi:hypothetical protein